MERTREAAGHGDALERARSRRLSPTIASSWWLGADDPVDLLARVVDRELAGCAPRSGRRERAARELAHDGLGAAAREADDVCAARGPRGLQDPIAAPRVRLNEVIGDAVRGGERGEREQRDS